jgi:hypothetical protein
MNYQTEPENSFQINPKNKLVINQFSINNSELVGPNTTCIWP